MRAWNYTLIAFKLIAIIRRIRQRKWLNCTTLSCDYGKAAHFWIGYIHMMHIYHEFERSIRLVHLDWYIFCLSHIESSCFAFNPVNYAHWLMI